jgi:hypothetical protein
MGNDLAPIPADDGNDDYELVDPADLGSVRSKSIEVVTTVGETGGATGGRDR